MCKNDLTVVASSHLTFTRIDRSYTVSRCVDEAIPSGHPFHLPSLDDVILISCLNIALSVFFSILSRRERHGLSEIGKWMRMRINGNCQMS